MNLVDLLALAVGLAMDAMAAAAARGLAAERLRARHALLVALWFGGAQGVMPAIGAVLGRAVGPAVAAWDHWIAFVVLVVLGLKMIHEARSATDAPPDGDRDGRLFSTRALAPVAVATSLDALAVGVTLPMMGARLLPACLTIGVVTAALSAAGLWAGRRFGSALGRRADALGGLVLVALGTKTLLEHLLRGG